MNTLKIENSEDLERERHSKCVMSTDAFGLKLYRQNRAKVRSEKERLNNVENELQELKILVGALLSTNGIRYNHNIG